MIDVNYADNLVFLANIPAQADSLIYKLEQAARGVGFNVNLDKTDSMYVKQDGAFKRQASEISRPFYISQQQYLMY